MQGCNNLLLRGNNTKIWLPGTREATFSGDTEGYLGFFTFVHNKGTCGLTGNWLIDLQEPAVNQGNIVDYFAGTYIDVDIDWIPAWSTVKSIARWSNDYKPLAFLAARSASGLAMTKIAGGNGRRYRIDITETGGQLDIINPSLTAINQRVSLQHCTYAGNVFHAIGNQNILIDEGVIIAGGAGMGMYGQASPTTWRGRIIRPYRSGVLSLLSTTVDGIHLKGCGPSLINGTLEGTGDDCVNVSCWTDAVISRNSASSLTISLSNPPDGAPVVGDFLELIDDTRVSRGKWRVTARADSGGPPATQAVFTVDINSEPLPTGVTSNWVCVNRSTAEGYVVDIRAGYNLQAAVRSSAADADITVDARNTMRALHEQGSFLNVEFMPAYDLRVRARGNFIGCSLDPIRSAQGAVAYRAFPRPTPPTGSSFLPKGAAGSVRILELDVTNTNNMVLYASSLDHLTIDNIRADRINLSPTQYDGLPNCYAQIILCDSVDANGLSLQGAITWPINLSSCNRFSCRNWSSNLIAPLSGATVIDLDLYLGAQVRITHGRYEMWGSGSRATGAASDPSVVFPIPFPTSCEGITGGIELGGASDNYAAMIAFQIADRYSFLARPRLIGPLNDVPAQGPSIPKPFNGKFYWYAWGK